MALDLTPEQRRPAQKNFARRRWLSRRGFMKGSSPRPAPPAVVAPAAYFGYKAWAGQAGQGRP